MKYLMLLLITISALSCGDDSESNQSNKVDISACFSPELGTTESEQFYYDILKGEINNNSKDNPTYSIKSGSKIVFVYRHISENLSNVIDDEFEERVLFQIDDNIDSFIIENQDQFNESKCIYGACGNSYPSVSFETISGSIVGSKISEGNWNVEVDLIIEKFNGGTDRILFNEIFLN